MLDTILMLETYKLNKVIPTSETKNTAIRYILCKT